MKITLSGEDIARTSPTADIDLARRIDEDGGVPRRSCTGLYPEPIDGPAPPYPLTIHPDKGGYFPTLVYLCRCGRPLEWSGQRWGCGNCE